MATHQANNRNYDVKIMESQSMTTKSLEGKTEEKHIPSADSSFSNRQFRFFKRQKQKNVEDEVEENADKMLKDLGLYEDGMTKQQKMELLNIIAESQQMAEKVEHFEEENEKWKEEILRQSTEEKSPAMEIADDITDSPVFDYCNARNNHSDDEIPTIQYENDSVPDSQDLFTSKPVESPESIHHSAEENLESNKSDEVDLSSKYSKKIRVRVRKRKLQEISNSPFEENTSDREMELFSSRKYPLKQQDVDYQAINVWNSREDNSSKLKINCQARKQLRRHDVPYFTPKGVTPHTQANCIVQDFENYFKLLYEAQNQVLNHMPWGNPVSVGRHHRGTLDVINCKKYLENKDRDIDSDETANIDHATETNTEQKEDPFLLNAIPLKDIDENEFPRSSQDTKVSINEEFAEGDIFEDVALPSLDTTKESSVFSQTSETKAPDSPFHRGHDSDVSLGCSGKNQTSIKLSTKKIKKTRSIQKIENGDSFFEGKEMEIVKNDCVTESESGMTGFCTPPKKFRSSFLNGLNNTDFVTSQQDLVDVLMYEEEENEMLAQNGEKSQTGDKSVVSSELNLQQSSESPPAIDFKSSGTPDLQTFNPIPEMEISNDSDSVACPLCAVFFPKSQIESHASECNGVDDNNVVEMVVATRTPKNKDRCYVCQNVFPKSKYEAHVKLCIASREETASDIQQELPIGLPTTTSKSTTGSRLLDGLTESEDLASTSKPINSGSFSPIKTFQPITNQGSTLFDYHNQFNQKKVRQNRTKSDTNLNAKLQVKKTKKKRL